MGNAPGNRSFDFADMIVNIQTGAQQTQPTTSPYFLGISETPLVKETETVDLYHPGPPYYCGTGALGSTDTIYCGFWSCL